MAEMRSREEAKKGGRGRSSGGGVENGERTARPAAQTGTHPRSHRWSPPDDPFLHTRCRTPSGGKKLP